MNLKEKIKSYSFWTSLSAAIVLVTETIFSLFGKPIFSASILGEVVMAICGLLVVLGFVTKPKHDSSNSGTSTDKTTDLDDKTVDLDK